MNNDQTKSIKELLKQDFTDESVVIELVSHPKPALIIAGLISLINNERAKFSKQIDDIMTRVQKLESISENVVANVDKAQSMIDIIKKNTSD